MTSLQCHSFSFSATPWAEELAGVRDGFESLLAGLVSLVYLGPGNVSVDQRAGLKPAEFVNERPN